MQPHKSTPMQQHTYCHRSVLHCQGSHQQRDRATWPQSGEAPWNQMPGMWTADWLLACRGDICEGCHADWYRCCPRTISDMNDLGGRKWYQSKCRPHMPIWLLYTLYGWLIPFGHNTQPGRHRDRQTEWSEQAAYAIASAAPNGKK